MSNILDLRISLRSRVRIGSATIIRILGESKVWNYLVVPDDELWLVPHAVRLQLSSHPVAQLLLGCPATMVMLRMHIIVQILFAAQYVASIVHYICIKLQLLQTLVNSWYWFGTGCPKKGGRQLFAYEMAKNWTILKMNTSKMGIFKDTNIKIVQICLKT